jgi:ABC-2 type transport system permease protein
MTTASIVQAKHAAVRPTHRPGFTDQMRSEWTKLKTLRSTWWSLAVMIVLSLGFSITACSIYTSTYSTLDPAMKAEFHADTIGLILQPGVGFASMAVCVLGVLLITSEYSTGMIRATTLATPRRTKALLAKAATFAAFIFVVSELIAIPAFFIGSAITGKYASTSITDPTDLRAILAFGGFMTAIGLIALSIGALVRHTAAGISLVLALQFVLPGVLNLIPGSVGQHLSNALPLNLDVVVSSGHNATDLYSPFQGMLFLVGWTVVLGAAALTTIKRRDV